MSSTVQMLFDSLRNKGASGESSTESTNDRNHISPRFSKPRNSGDNLPTFGPHSPMALRSVQIDTNNLDPSSVGLPLLYVSAGGTISVVLAQEIIVEITTDRTIRVVSHDKGWAIASDGRGVFSALLHRAARLFKKEDKVDCVFESINESAEKKIAVIGPQGVLFTMSHIKQAFLVSSTLVKGTSTMSTDNIRFPDLQKDVTLDVFYGQSKNGPSLVPVCNDIVKAAFYERKPDGSIDLNINGLAIHQKSDGTVTIDGRSLHVECSPLTSCINVRTHAVEMGIEADGKAYVKQGAKRVHVSRSGMLVSDGNFIASMDHTGRIVSCI
ncbi:Protein C44B9.2 [Aphelenchoides avenae]|nr:Protein C44B9.2 [Aphelenchus avenae]